MLAGIIDKIKENSGENDGKVQIAYKNTIDDTVQESKMNQQEKDDRQDTLEDAHE